MTQALESTLPVTGVTPVFVAARDLTTLSEKERADWAGSDLLAPSPQPIEDPAQPCPIWAEVGNARTVPADIQAKYADDPRCWDFYAEFDLQYGPAIGGVIVDDGRAMRATGMPGAAKAAQALAFCRLRFSRALGCGPCSGVSSPPPTGCPRLPNTAKRPRRFWG